MSTGLFPGPVVDVMAGATGCVIEEDAGSQGTQAFRKLKRCGEGPPGSLQKEPARLQWAWDAQSCRRGKGCGVSSMLRVRVAGAGKLSVLEGEMQAQLLAGPESSGPSAQSGGLKKVLGLSWVGLRGGVSSEECSEETALLILERLDRRGWCGPEKSRQHWLVMAGGGEQVWGQLGRTWGVWMGTWAQRGHGERRGSRSGF